MEGSDRAWLVFVCGKFKSLPRSHQNITGTTYPPPAVFCYLIHCDCLLILSISHGLKICNGLCFFVRLTQSSQESQINIYSWNFNIIVRAAKCEHIFLFLLIRKKFHIRNLLSKMISLQFSARGIKKLFVYGIDYVLDLFTILWKSDSCSSSTVLQNYHKRW